MKKEKQSPNSTTLPKLSIFCENIGRSTSVSVRAIQSAVTERSHLRRQMCWG